MCKIFFIDDQQEPLFYHRMFLAEAGYSIEPYRSPEAAIQFFVNGALDTIPDLIILDLNMPPDGRYANDPGNGDGRRTGVLLFKDICNQLGRLRLILPPVVVLTQIRNPEILNEVATVSPETLILDKFETAPSELLRHVKTLLATPAKPNDR